MIRLLVFCLLFALGAAEAAPREIGPREIDNHRWAGVDRVVAVGDLHGDYANYIATLRAAGIVDRRDRWIGGSTHLVQTGDIPDRGPDTKKIIEHMARLARQASRNGGRVHNLIGNHEAMNVYGDLRYVTAEEFAAFETPRSKALRERYLDALLDDMSSRDPARFAALPDDFRDQWYADRPPGWVEHRQAWNPQWNPDGEMFDWVAGARVAVQINDTLFVHGGISGHYCRDTLASMTERAQADLARGDLPDESILTDQYGPLWYRGLAGVAPEAPPETVDRILRNHDARHIVIGHTPTGGFIRPRYDGRVIQIDTGISDAYGGHVAYLEITPEGLFAGYRPGKVELPADDTGLAGYLEKLAELLPGNDALRREREALRARALNANGLNAAEETEPRATGKNGAGVEQAANAEPIAEPIPICGTRL